MYICVVCRLGAISSVKYFNKGYIIIIHSVYSMFLSKVHPSFSPWESIRFLRNLSSDMYALHKPKSAEYMGNSHLRELPQQTYDV